MTGHFFDRHQLAQFVNVDSQPTRNPLVGVEEVQLFYPRPAAIRAQKRSVTTVDPDLRRAEIQVSKRSILLAVDSVARLPANMANGPESLVGDHPDESLQRIGRNLLLDNADSLEGKIVCYTQAGHRRPPLDNVLDYTQVYYPSEIPDVHYYLNPATR